MKLIIDIDEDIYKNKNYFDYFGCTSLTLADVIENGTPLEQIRDEIEQAKTIEIKMDDTAFKVSADLVINPRYRNFTSGLDIALQIIDKYKAERKK